MASVKMNQLQASCVTRRRASEHQDEAARLQLLVSLCDQRHSLQASEHKRHTVARNCRLIRAGRAESDSTTDTAREAQLEEGV